MIEYLVSGQGISPMKQKVKAITDLAPKTSMTEARCMIGLIGYYRKFFPIFIDIIPLLNELTKMNVPLKWNKQCQESLDYIKQVMTTSPILVYSDPDKNITFLEWNYHTVHWAYKRRWIKNKNTSPYHLPKWYFSRFSEKVKHYNKKPMQLICPLTKWYFTWRVLM